MLNEEMKVDKEVKLKFENNKLLLTLTKVFNKMHEMVNMLIVNGTIHFGLSSSSNSELICVKIPNSCDPSISMELIGIKCQELNKAVTKFKKDFEITIKDTIKISSGSKALQIPIYETDYEFQDVNFIQYNIIMSLVKDNNLTIVGDDFQSIFGWRGANPDFFINAKDKIENSKLFKLEQNYRSAKNIVEMSNDIIKKNTNQIQKICYSTIESRFQPTIMTFKSDDIEAKSIANNCQLAVNKLKYSFNDIAILYRAKFISRSVEKALKDFGIPYTIIGSVAFFERREIKDIMSYLKFAFNTKDNESFTRSVSVPRRGVGKSTLQKIQKQPHDDIMSKLYYSLSSLSNKVSTNLLSYYNLINQIINKEPQDAITTVVNSINFKNELKSMSADEEDYTDRKENIQELISFSSNFKNISDLIDESSLMTSNDEEEEAEKVKLMTIHSAKGLEFKMVVVIGLEDGLFPHWKSLKSDRELNTNKHLEEERRLFYVATTRAKEILCVTNVQKRTCSMSTRPSRFISEVKKHFINGK